VLSKNVRHVSVPHYSSLSIQKISHFVSSKNQDMHLYIPDNQEIKKISREWICNICASVMGTDFTDWLKIQIEERNEEVKDKKDLNIELDPDVAAAFRASTAVSCKCCRLQTLSIFFYYSVQGPGRQHAEGGLQAPTHAGPDHLGQRGYRFAGDGSGGSNGRAGQPPGTSAIG